jgi:hypothetical protein
MAISTEGKLGLLVGLLGVGGGGAIMIWPDHTEIGWAMIAVAGCGGAALGWYHFSATLSRLWGPTRRTRMIALIGMIIFGFGFLASATVYFWPAGAAKPWKHTLDEIYASDTNGLGNMENKWQVGVSNAARGLERTTLTLRYRLYQDFNSNSDYVSIFIPTTHNALIDDETFNLVKWLRDEILPFRENLRNAVGVGMSRPGVPYTEASGMRFSGRVYIYTMQPLTLVQLGQLTSWYETAGLALQIRGNEYWLANKDRK